MPTLNKSKFDLPHALFTYSDSQHNYLKIQSFKVKIKSEDLKTKCLTDELHKIHAVCCR